MRTTVLLLVSVLTSFSLVACSSSDDEAAAGAQASAQSAVERCSGGFVCSSSTTSTDTRLERRGDGCYAGQIRLDPDGTAVADDLSATWRETAGGFDICIDGECLQCVSTDPAPATTAPNATSKGSCEGSASSCYGRMAGSCGSQDGCYGGTHIRWNGDMEFECKGVAESCDRFSSESSCKAQSGCSWKP